MSPSTSREAKSFEINPYSRWVHDYPERLLADPSPAELEALRQKKPGQRLHVELGSGSGNFLRQLAGQHPQDHFVGFEIRFKRLVRSAQKLERDGQDHVWFVKEEGERFADYFPPESIDQFYVNFPDPWPKRRQWRKRLVSQPLLQALHSRLTPSGRFHLKTDHSGYFLHVLQVVSQMPQWRLCYFSNHLHRQAAQGSFGVITEFEQLFIQHQRPIYALSLAKA